MWARMAEAAGKVFVARLGCVKRRQGRTDPPYPGVRGPRWGSWMWDRHRTNRLRSEADQQQTDSPQVAAERKATTASKAGSTTRKPVVGCEGAGAFPCFA